MTFFEAVIQGFGLSLGGGTVAVLWRWTEPVRKSMADALRWKLIMWRRHRREGGRGRSCENHPMLAWLPSVVALVANLPRGPTGALVHSKP